MKEKINRFVGFFLVFLMATMLLAVLWQVFTRYLLNSPSSFTGELARFLLIWVGMLGAAYASGQQMHLAIDLLPSSLTGRKKRMLDIIIKSLILLFALVALVIGGTQLVYITWSLGQTSPTLQIPMAFVYLILPVSGLLIMYYKVLEIMNLEEEHPARAQIENINENN
jgi:TRAP-type C4-dicarboxylate transport system permease small subunit